jgi:hypothetical protein
MVNLLNQLVPGFYNNIVGCNFTRHFFFIVKIVRLNYKTKTMCNSKDE